MFCNEKYTVFIRVWAFCKRLNQIHYGKDADVLLRKLYEERKDALASVGIKITLERLLEMYGYVA